MFVDTMDTRFIDLSTRQPLAGYADSVALIARLAHDLGRYSLRDAAIDASSAIDSHRRELDALRVEPTAEEWDDALHHADYALARMERRLYDETNGYWVGSFFEGDYVIASSDWWNQLGV